MPYKVCERLFTNKWDKVLSQKITCLVLPIFKCSLLKFKTVKSKRTQVILQNMEILLFKNNMRERKKVAFSKCS